MQSDSTRIFGALESLTKRVIIEKRLASCGGQGAVI
jgi:hypothetical protein